MTGARYRFGRVLLGLLAAALSACSAVDFVPPQQRGDVYAREAGWTRIIIPAGQFDVLGYRPPRQAERGTLAVYLEGDGLAYLSRHEVSADPTPDDPVALRLALQHPNGVAAHLARPCQFILREHGRNCDPAYWTGWRYAPEIVASQSAAVDVLKHEAGARSVILVGYSGGGALAVLVAAARTDVVGIVTIAANLDLAEWTARQGLAPLAGSLDPADVVASISAIPEVHFIGAEDAVVPREVALAYLRRSGPSPAIALVEIPGFGHHCCWVEAWPRLAGRPELRRIPGWDAVGR